MYGERAVEDGVRILRGMVTNQLARLAPSAYLKLTAQTGRGERQGETPESVADYFLRCFRECFEILGVSQAEVPDYLSGKSLLEYGPGDIPGVALLMFAFGAEKVYCVDRFPLLSLSPCDAEIIHCLVDRLPAQARSRARSCLSGKLAFDPDRLQYLVRPSGLSGIWSAVDLVYSRAVLEHVDDLAATFADMETALRPGGKAVHLVDLKSHGLHRTNRLDFLTWPQSLWSLMYSHKGVPNRWRVDRYRDILGRGALRVLRLAPTGNASAEEVREVRPYLDAPFQHIADSDLACLGFWLLCEK